jgi:hypothetical protein
MPSALLVFPIGEAVCTFKGTGCVNRNLFGWDACQFTLFFNGQLIINMVFIGFFI